MAERNTGTRRRKAFADFKENQYDDSFSLSRSQKRKIFLKNVFKYIFIILATIVFIAVGFVVTDALLDISETEYHDTKTYVPTNTTQPETTLLPTNPPEESTSGNEITSEEENPSSQEQEDSTTPDNQNFAEQQ